jgi:hypothetical protein
VGYPSLYLFLFVVGDMMAIKLTYGEPGMGLWKITPVSPSSKDFDSLIDTINGRLVYFDVDYRLVCSYLLGHPELGKFVKMRKKRKDGAILWLFKLEILPNKGTYVLLSNEVGGSINRIALYTSISSDTIKKILRDYMREYLNKKIAEGEPTEYTAEFSRYKVGVFKEKGELHRFVAELGDSHKYYEGDLEQPILM